MGQKQDWDSSQQNDPKRKTRKCTSNQSKSKGGSKNSNKFWDLLDKREVSVTAREYLDCLRNSKNIEEVVQITNVIPFIVPKREIEEAQQACRPWQSLPKQLVKGAINFIIHELALDFSACENT
ncbi:uncharacterized protein LOC143261243 [Megalopta genalis]|uniref:uncharacterized protein LOC143261243 n=1 Tax=Megalopta genalis TaxID=115081 RepID=UPI003FD3F34D